MYLLSFLCGGLGATPYRDKDITNYRGKISRETNQNDIMQALMYLTKKKRGRSKFLFQVFSGFNTQGQVHILDRPKINQILSKFWGLCDF